MKLTLALTTSILIAAAAWIAGLLVAVPNLIILGGEHTLQTGEIIAGDVIILFADLNLEPGAQVRGDITALSSTIQTQGFIQGELFSLDADIKADDPAHLPGDQHTYDLLPFEVLLPALARIELAPNP